MPDRPPNCRNIEIGYTISEMHVLSPKLEGKRCRRQVLGTWYSVLTVLVVWSEDASERPEGGPPERVLQVVARAVGQAVGVVGVAAGRRVVADVRSSDRGQPAHPLVPQRGQVVAARQGERHRRLAMGYYFFVPLTTDIHNPFTASVDFFHLPRC